jgi:hypothetical protein
VVGERKQTEYPDKLGRLQRANKLENPGGAPSHDAGKRSDRARAERRERHDQYAPVQSTVCSCLTFSMAW